MAVATAEQLRRNHGTAGWLAFALQVLIAVSVELGDDLGRGIFSQRGTVEGVQDAREVVGFEVAHGFWIEPAWQSFFLHTHRFFALTITWPEVARVMNGVYVFGHIFVTLGVALWVYMYRRGFFRLLRNTVILANLIALFLYESFPVAPPRLTTHLLFNHHTFQFQDTLYGVFSSTGRLVGSAGAYNEFSAMPSVHMIWAMIAGAALVCLSRRLLVMALGVIYPGLMLLAIVVTGNHYLLDAFGAMCVVVVALPLALAFEVWKGQFTWAGRPLRHTRESSFS